MENCNHPLGFQNGKCAMGCGRTVDDVFDAAAEQRSMELLEANRDYYKERCLLAEKKLQIAVHTLEGIGAYNDKHAWARQNRTGSYSAFDEPGSVQEAHEALLAMVKVEMEKKDD